MCVYDYLVDCYKLCGWEPNSVGVLLRKQSGFYPDGCTCMILDVGDAYLTTLLVNLDEMRKVTNAHLATLISHEGNMKSGALNIVFCSEHERSIGMRDADYGSAIPAVIFCSAHNCDQHTRHLAQFKRMLGITDNQTVGNPELPSGLGEPLPDEVMTKSFPPHKTVFDEQDFLKALSGSISLCLKEKIKIIEVIPTLEQYQIDRLMEIFKEEAGQLEALGICIF